LESHERDFLGVRNQADIAPTIEFKHIFSIAHKLRFYLIAIVFGSTLVGIAAAYLITPIYRAEVLLAPASDSEQGSGLAALAGQFGGLASLSGINLGRSSTIAEAVGILESRAFSEKFIIEQSLMPVLFSDDWSDSKNDWNVSDPQDIPTIQDAYELFDEEIRSISADRQNSLYTLTIEWKDRHLAAQWANELVRRLNTHVRALDLEESEKSITLLTGELENAQALELRQGIAQIIEKHVEALTLARVRTEYVFRILDPAIAPDEDKFVWPNRLLIIAVGLGLGMTLALVLILVRSRRQ